MSTIEAAEAPPVTVSAVAAEPRIGTTQPHRAPVVVSEAAGKGRGVFSARKLAEGDVVIVGTPLFESPQRTWQSVQTDIDNHVRMDEPFELVNHSCDPTCGVRPNRIGGYDLIARRPIAVGEEITFDYCTTEWECIGFRDCHCGSDHCRGIVGGAKYLALEVLDAYGSFVAPHLVIRKTTT